MIEAIVYAAARQALRVLAFGVGLGVIVGASAFAVWIYLL